MIRSPFKRASQAVDNIDYSTDEGKDKGARVAVILAPIAIVLTVLAVVGIWLFASGRFNPEKDAFQEAQKQLQENTERSEKGVANAGVTPQERSSVRVQDPRRHGNVRRRLQQRPQHHSGWLYDLDARGWLLLPVRRRVERLVCRSCW